MSEFNELIKSFAKSREYVRDFFVYGFKTRDEFPNWSMRTYDNERRRVESWLSGYVRQEQTAHGKNIYLSIDSNLLDTNPLYRVWKAKSFTDNDIMLHFFILDYLNKSEGETTDEITDGILDCYGACLDSQLIRRKCNEYAKEGILRKCKSGKEMLYLLNENFRDTVDEIPKLLDAVRLYQFASPFGILGDTILDNLSEQNDYFRIKHSFFVHTLEDEVMLSVLDAIHQKCAVALTMNSTKTDRRIILNDGIPLRIFTSTRTGRRFLCLYLPKSKRFSMYRMDAIKAVTTGKPCENYDSLRDMLTQNQPRLWGVSFQSTDGRHFEHVKLTLRINENYEQFIINRLEREHNGGIITHIGRNTYTYDVDVFDANEMLPWIRTFTGRIIDIESDCSRIKRVFNHDMNEMYKIYLPESEE